MGDEEDVISGSGDGFCGHTDVGVVLLGMRNHL